MVAIRKPEFGSYRLAIIYQPQGFLLLTESASDAQLDNNLRFARLVFSTSPLEEGLADYSQEVLVPWQGMKESDFYCRLENGGACR